MEPFSSSNNFSYVTDDERSNLTTTKISTSNKRDKTKTRTYCVNGNINHHSKSLSLTSSLQQQLQRSSSLNHQYTKNKFLVQQQQRQRVRSLLLKLLEQKYKDDKQGAMYSNNKNEMKNKTCSNHHVKTAITLEKILFQRTNLYDRSCSSSNSSNSSSSSSSSSRQQQYHDISVDDQMLKESICHLMVQILQRQQKQSMIETNRYSVLHKVLLQKRRQEEEEQQQQQQQQISCTSSSSAGCLGGSSSLEKVGVATGEDVPPPMLLFDRICRALDTIRRIKSEWVVPTTTTSSASASSASYEQQKNGTTLKIPKEIQNLYFQTTLFTVFENAPIDTFTSLPWERMVCIAEKNINAYYQKYH